MLKNIIPTLIFICFSINLFSQNCLEENLLQQPGKWKAGMSGSASKSPATVQAQAKKVTDAIHQLLVKNYLPKGLEAQYANTKPYPSSSKEYKPSDYYFTIYFMSYYCESGIQNKSHETSSSLTVTANRPPIFFTHNVIDSYIGERFEKENYGWLDQRPVLENGAWNLGSSQGKNAFGVLLKKTDWIITYDDKVPFLYVSRKEYLEALKSKLLLAQEANEQTIRSNTHIRSKSEQDAEKKKIIDEYSKTEGGRNWLKRYLADYKTDEEKLDERIKNSNSSDIEKINLVETNLKMPAEELEKNAIISSVSEFKGFVEEDDRYARFIIKENPVYYNKKNNPAVPQLFGIEFTIEIENPIAVQAYNDVMKALDFSVLKNMLGQ